MRLNRAMIVTALMGFPAMAAVMADSPPSSAGVVSPPPSNCLYPSESSVAPPVGFDPKTASAKDLAAAGFPPRPPGGDADPAVVDWKAAIGSAKIYDKPQGACPQSPGMDGVGDVGPGLGHTQYSGNWAGYIASASAVNIPAVNWSQSRWTVPTVGSDANYSICNADDLGNAPTASLWVGTGAQYLIQAGTDSCMDATPTYRFWNEDLPQGSRYQGPSVGGGDSVYVATNWVTDGQCTFFEENVTTGHYANYANSSCFYHGASAANFVLERLGSRRLPAFADIPQTGNYYGDNNSSWFPVSSKTDRMIMTSDCTANGTVLSSPTLLDSGGGFHQRYMASLPICQAY